MSRRTFLFSLTLVGLATTSNAQWVGMSIHPGGDFSAAYGAGTGIAVGNSGTSLSEAGYWTNGGSTYHSLHNDDWTSSIAMAGSLSMQVGGVQNPGNVHACRWFGTTATFQDMNPSRASHSQAYAVSGNEFAGWATFNGDDHAILWHGGGNDDYTDLTPAWAEHAEVFAMDGTQQAGTAVGPGFTIMPGYWTGTADSFVDLTPVAGANGNCLAVAAGRQGGTVALPGQQDHAFLWSGTAASAIDLHPDSQEISHLNGMSANYQVGATFFTSDHFYSHAAIWSGTKDSWVDIHSFLPAEFVNSEATSIVEYADRTEIYGFAYRGSMGGDRFAVMWTQPVPEPASIAVLGLGALGLLRRRRR